MTDFDRTMKQFDKLDRLLLIAAILFGLAAGAVFCFGQVPPFPPMPVEFAADTNTGPELVDVTFAWDPSPDKVSAYTLTIGTNSITTTNTTATITAPLATPFTAAVVAVAANSVESEPATLSTSINWSNWVEVAAINPRLLHSSVPFGPFVPCNTQHIVLPARSQAEAQFYTATADAHIVSRRTLVPSVP